MINKCISTIALIGIFIPSCVFAQMLSVKGSNVNLRSGPGQSTSTHWEYDNGVPLQVMKKKGEWVQVIDFEGDSGWIHKTLLSPTPHYIVKANRKDRSKTINIRQKPSTSAPVVAQATYGVVFETLSRKNGWTQVRHSDGVEGWVSNFLLWGF